MLLLLFIVPAFATSTSPQSRHSEPGNSATSSAAHVFTGAITRVSPELNVRAARAKPPRFALLVVETVDTGSLSPADEVTIEFESDGGWDYSAGDCVRCCSDADFRVLPGGLEFVARASTLSDEEKLRRREEWPRVLFMLRANWMTSRFLRTKSSSSPPDLASERDLHGVVVLKRDVTKRECHWLDRDLMAGERFRVYGGHTYGAISPVGIAVTDVDDENGPFMELPKDAVREDEV